MPLEVITVDAVRTIVDAMVHEADHLLHDVGP